MKNEVLIVIDVQNDFCPGGALAVEDGDEIVLLVNAHMQRFAHVILTQDWHPSGHSSFASEHAGKSAFETIRMPYGQQTLWPDHCVQGSPGADFHPGLDLNRAELIIRKGFRREVDSYSAFFENDM
jgi:nicotinamidase/pyrazinamidase